MTCPTPYNLLFASAILLSACTTTSPQEVPPAQQASATEMAEGTEEENIISISGHLVCAYMHDFFIPDPGTRESLHHQNAPEWMIPEKDGDFEEYGGRSSANAEAYFAFRSSYLPPVRSFIRVPVADTHYEQSHGWDECCPVRVTLRYNRACEKWIYTDFAPASREFLQKMADDYNSTVTSGLYKGMAGSPTTEDMRGKALPVDWELCIDNPGPLARRYQQEGEKAWAAAEAEAERLNATERNYVPLSDIVEPDSRRMEEWAILSNDGKTLNIPETPYRLRIADNRLVFEEVQEDTIRQKLEICETLAASLHGMALYLAPDGKGIIIGDTSPSCLTWRNGAPECEQPLVYRSSLARTGCKTIQKFVGWLNNIPVTEHSETNG